MKLVNLDEAIKILYNDHSMRLDLSDHNAKVRADTIDEIRDKMTFQSYGLGGYLTISVDDWEKIRDR